MRLFLFPILFFGMPLAEIAGFVLVGKWLGLWPTLALVILSSVVGIVLLRLQGLSLLREIAEEGRNGRVPGKAIVNGAMIVVAAILLIVPGFLTDLIGIMLFIPAVRDRLWSLIGRRVVVRSTYPGGGPAPREPRQPGQPEQSPARTIDLQESDYERKPNPSSPWSDRQDPDGDGRSGL